MQLTSAEIFLTCNQALGVRCLMPLLFMGGSSFLK